MKSSKFLVFLLTFGTLTACFEGENASNAGSKRSKVSAEKTNASPPVPIQQVVYSKNVASPELQKEASAKIKEIIERFNDANCSNHPDARECQKLEYQWIPARPLASSEHQRILILEDRLPPHSLFGRYRNRVLGIFDIQNDGTRQYAPIYPKAQIYSAYDKIGSYLSELPHIPVQALGLYQFPGISEVSEVTALNYHDEEPGGWLRHQEDLFELLADMNPNAQFVFARYPSFGKNKELVCNYLNDNNRQNLIHYYYNAGTALLDLVRKYGITHINASFILWWLEDLQEVAKDCGVDPDQLDQLKDDYWKDLLDIERAPLEALKQVENQTLVFKSVDNNPKYPIKADSLEYVNQCIPYENFVNVGYLSVPTSNFSVQGSTLKPNLLDNDQKNNIFCANLFVNGGYEKHDIRQKPILGPKPLKYIVDGLQYFIAGEEAIVMSSSIATSLALSYSIFLQEQFNGYYHRYPSAVELRGYLNRIGNRPWMIDPLFHDHFELYRR